MILYFFQRPFCLLKRSDDRDRLNSFKSVNNINHTTRNKQVIITRYNNVTCSVNITLKAQYSLIKMLLQEKMKGIFLLFKKQKQFILRS